MSMLTQSSARRLVDALSQPVPDQTMPPLPADVLAGYGAIWSGFREFQRAPNEQAKSYWVSRIDAAITAALHEYGRVVAAECVLICLYEGLACEMDNTDEAYNTAVQDCAAAIRKRFNLE